jgi:hypothetical protein
MSLSFEFYAGNAETIGQSFSAVDFDRLRNDPNNVAYADLSLHVSLDHLDLLSELLARRASKPPLLLSNNLVRNVGAIGDEGGADVVSRDWVLLVASIPPQSATDIVAEWIHAVGVAERQNLQPTPEAAAAVARLISICRGAIDNGSDVVFGWYL